MSNEIEQLKQIMAFRGQTLESILKNKDLPKIESYSVVDFYGKMKRLILTLIALKGSQSEKYNREDLQLMCQVVCAELYTKGYKHYSFEVIEYLLWNSCLKGELFITASSVIQNLSAKMNSEGFRALQKRVDEQEVKAKMLAEPQMTEEERVEQMTRLQKLMANLGLKRV